jgi:hypothetical protein
LSYDLISRKALCTYLHSECEFYDELMSIHVLHIRHEGREWKMTYVEIILPMSAHSITNLINCLANTT